MFVNPRTLARKEKIENDYNSHNQTSYFFLNILLFYGNIITK